MKAYEVEATPTRGPMPRLVETFQLADAHGRYQDKFTDQAGAFPKGGSAGKANSIAERQGIEAETEARLFRQLGEHIVSLLRAHNPARWSFAAPSEINGAILSSLPPEWNERLDFNAKRDLINTLPAELLAHFTRS